jgi:uncharacterized membrane protein YgcG
MKNNSTKIWEEYLEYAVLVIAILLLCWFAWGAFGSDIEVNVGKRVVSASTLDEELLDVARSMEPKIRDDAPSPVDIQAPTSLSDDFNQKQQQTISPNDRVVFPTIDMTSNVDMSQDVLAELVMYSEPTIASPTDVRPRQWYGTILESEIERVEELSDLIDGPPHDTSWIQIDALFDIDAAVTSFRSSTENLEPIPDRWYDGGADIFDIQIERQELNNGIWSDAKLISVLPGHLVYRDRVEGGTIDSTEKERIIHDLRSGMQDQITRPAFYLCKNNSPSKDDLDPATWDDSVREMTEKGLLQKKLSQVDKKIVKQQELIDKINQRIQDEGSGRGDGNSMGGGGGPMGGGSSGGKGETKLDRLRRQLDSAKEKMQSYLRKRSEAEEEIAALDEEQPNVEEVIMEGEVRVWGHDMSVLAGSTYRYRMSVQLANPFFGHKPSLYPEQKHLAEKVTVPSLVSEWSPEIEVQEPMQWFILNAKKSGESRNPDALDSGYISVELFEFSDGNWSQDNFIVQVGQRIGQLNEEETDVDWFVLDILEDVSGDIVLLQHIVSGELRTMYPSIESQRSELHLLRQQVRDQGDSQGDPEPQDKPSDPQDPFDDSPPDDPKGSGGGGAMT